MAKPSLNKDSLTASEVGRLLGVTRQRVYGLVKAGAFPGAQRHGWMWIIPREDVANYQNARKDEPEAVADGA